jgi:hypothetical protein
MWVGVWVRSYHKLMALICNVIFAKSAELSSATLTPALMGAHGPDRRR